jgi:hypothetical protein
MLAANCAKLTVAQLLTATLDYGIIRLFCRDLQSSQETQNPSKATPWGFDSDPNPKTKPLGS